MPEEQKVTRKLTAILSADVKGYSILMSNDEAFTVKTLKEYRTVMSEQIERHAGRVVDAPGDNLLAEFASVVDAVQCAVGIQKILKDKNEGLPVDKRLEFRIGVNIGDVIQDGNHLFGEGVNIAARIEGLAEPGGVCISRNAYDHIGNKLSLGYEYLGEHSVKNISIPVRVYKVLMADEDAGKLIGDVPKPVAKNWIWATIVVAAVAIMAVAFLLYQNVSKPEFEPAKVENMSYPLPNKPSIAVLPFDNMSSDPDQEFFSDGITEEIITALSKTPKMFVIARNSTFTYKGKTIKFQQVAEELGVRYVLEGSVRKSEGQVRITAQLIDALTGEHLWAERYDRELKNIFALQDEITKEIITALHIKLTHGEQARIYAKGTDNLQAYLKAMQAQWYSYLWTQRGNAEAKRLIKEAIAIDPDYAYAYRALGTTNVVDFILRSTDSPKESLQKAMEAYNKAIALDQYLGSAYAGMAGVLVIMSKYDEALHLGKKAVELEPNSADVLNIYAAILTYSGAVDEAIPAFRAALRLNPKPPNSYYHYFGHALHLSGQYEEAIALQKEAIKQEPDDVFSYLILAYTAHMAGRDQEAQAAVKEILRIDPQFSAKKLVAPFKDRTILRKNCEALNSAGMSLNCDVFPAAERSIAKPDKPSIAVLPFDNLSDDPEQEYFSDGMTDDIITGLSKIKELLVISRNSTFTYKGQDKRIPEIAKELNVRYVLEGSVRKAGNQIRINAQLIDAITDHHLWAERFDGSLEDVFALQDMISSKIVSALAVRISGSEENIKGDKETNNILAYEAYLKGMAHMRRFTPDDYVKAIDYFKKAIELDQNYSQAYAALAYTYWNTFAGGKRFWDEIGIDYINSRILARHYLEMAMEKPSSMGYQLMALMELFRRQYNDALEFAEKAVSISPNDADALYYLGTMMIYADNPEEGIKYIKKSVMQDPMFKTTITIGVGCFSLGDYEKTVKYINIGLADNPERIPFLIYTAAAHGFLGNELEAKKALEEWLMCFASGYPSVQGLYYLYPFKNLAVFDRLLEGVIKAGYKAGSSDYYRLDEANKLKGQEIRELLFGKTQTGTFFGFQWSIIRDKYGEAQYPSPWGEVDQGKSWIEGDAIYSQFKKRYNGIQYSCNIYSNPEGNDKTKSEYLAVCDFGIIPFSVEQ